MTGALTLTIVTPEGRVCASDTDSVCLTGQEGEMTLYPGHMPLMTRVQAGEVIAWIGPTRRSFAVGEGFAEVAGDRVTILTDMAVDAAKIDEAAAEEARQKAEARRAEQLTEEELAALNASLARSMTLLAVKRRYKGTPQG